MDKARFQYLDVLKAIAIIAVVLYHSGFLTYGYLGVDLFLVINGYLITKGLVRKVITVNDSNKGRNNYFEFEISRIIRLLPVLLLAGIVCMSLGYVAMLPDDYENLSESVIASNCFANNILAAITTKNYWDVVNDYKPLMHTWYVGLVMQFYIVYPFIFYLARLNRKNPQKTLILLLSLFGIASLIIYFTLLDDAQRFYYLPSRFFEFVVGGLIALTWNSAKEHRILKSWFVYLCYAFLLIIFCFNQELFSSRFKLVLVVALSAILLMSGNILENKITGNIVVARIGAASYSIFIWHQVILAFYRYTISSHFTILSYGIYLFVVCALSWLTYRFIEQKTNLWLRERSSKVLMYIITIVVFICLNGYAGYIYMHAGVIRDVPELYIDKNDIHRGLHSEYNDKIYQYNKPFETDKKHWLIVGNSFGRDFANVILESAIADSVEISYLSMDDFKLPSNSVKFVSADRVFLSSLGFDEKTVEDVETICSANDMPVENLIIVGTKNFGECNGQFYIKRNNKDYFEQRTEMEKGYFENNVHMKSVYGNRYLDLIELVIDEKGTMPVFTPDHHFISQDCRHFSKGGAIWFSQLINWKPFM